MNTLELNKMTQQMAAFSGGMIQDFEQLLIHLESNGYTIKDFKKWLKFHRKKILKNYDKHYHPGRMPITCPVCTIMKTVIYDVNTSACNRVDGPYRSQIMCSDWEYCGWEMFSVKTPDQWRNLIAHVGPERALEIPDLAAPVPPPMKVKSSGGCGSCKGS